MNKTIPVSMAVNGALDVTNYRAAAQRIIERYEKIGLIVDALVWSQVIAHYEAALKEKDQNV